MRKETMSFARFNEAMRDGSIKDSERAASRDVTGSVSSSSWGSVIVQWWPSRGAMARSVRMQEKRERQSMDWRPCIKLRDGEGY